MSRDYLRQVEASKALLYAACDRLGLKYWPSEANFVLVRVGDRATALVKGAAARGIYLRDRSTEPGCAGCVRIAAGIVEHTRRADCGDGGAAVRRGADRSPHDGDADRAARSRSTAAARIASARASGFSITCSSCSRGTAAST